MLTIQQIQELVKLADRSISLGGYYKNNAIPLAIQPIIAKIKSQVNFVNSVDNLPLSLDELNTLEHFFYNPTPPSEKFNNSAYQTLLKRNVLTKSDIWLPLIRPNVYSLVVYPAVMKQTIFVGQIYELFDSQNKSVKGIVKEVNLANDEVVILPHNNSSTYIKAKFLDWWSPVKQLAQWVDYSCFEDKDSTNSFFAVHSNFPADYKLSSVRWSFYYNNSVMAKGVDSITPGLCSLSTANKVFKPGVYTIKAKRMLNSVSAAKQDFKQVELTIYNSSIIFDPLSLI